MFGIDEVEEESRAKERGQSNVCWLNFDFKGFKEEKRLLDAGAIFSLGLGDRLDSIRCSLYQLSLGRALEMLKFKITELD